MYDLEKLFWLYTTYMVMSCLLLSLVFNFGLGSAILGALFLALLCTLYDISIQFVWTKEEIENGVLKTSYPLVWFAILWCLFGFRPEVVVGPAIMLGAVCTLVEHCVRAYLSNDANSDDFDD